MPIRKSFLFLTHELNAQVIHCSSEDRRGQEEGRRAGKEREKKMLRNAHCLYSLLTANTFIVGYYLRKRPAVFFMCTKKSHDGRLNNAGVSFITCRSKYTIKQLLIVNWKLLSLICGSFISINNIYQANVY